MKSALWTPVWSRIEERTRASPIDLQRTRASVAAINVKRLAMFPETELVPRRVLARSVWSWPDFAYAVWPGLFQTLRNVCGPVAMMAAVIRSMGALGVPPDQIRTEVFRLQ